MDYKIELIDLLKEAAYSHTVYTVFIDFVTMTAIAISNSYDKVHFEGREKQYLSIINKYGKREQQLFPKMFGVLVMALEHEAQTSGPRDILGEIYEEIGAGSKELQHFFTPQNVAEMMSLMTIDEDDKIIKKYGFIKALEPCSGSGRMIFAFAKAMQQRGYIYQTQLYVEAVDIDSVCVCMTFIQLALYGIPAVVTHGNFLTLDIWSPWYTPVYLIDDWYNRMKLVHKVLLIMDFMLYTFKKHDKEATTSVPDPEQINKYMEATHEQISLDLGAGLSKGDMQKPTPIKSVKGARSETKQHQLNLFDL